MHLLHKGIALISLSILCAAKQWPYDRYHGIKSKTGHYEPQTSAPEFQDEVHNHFGQWFHHIVDRNDPGHLQELFINGSVPRNASFKDILHNLNVPEKTPGNGTILPPHVPLPWPQQQANALFTHLPYPIDPRCTSDRSKWWFRTYDGSCNWLKVGEMSEGQYGTAKSRDYGQHYYADGISKPREGPNPRAVSNAFFRRKKTLYYEHTPLLLGLVEFIMHDITWSQDSSSECINVPMPEDEDYFFHNTTFRVWRTEPVPGTGSSPENPRENVNRATTWLDVSSLYGSTPEVARALRSFNKGKLLAQDLVTRGTKRKASYLPFNTMDVPTRTQPGIDTKTLFAGGDPRTNEDWVMLGVHTLLLREHNRLCDLLAEKHPEYDEEQLYQTVRLILSAKFSLIGNAYQMAYFKNMTWPRDDGFPLYREMSGKNFLQINPANTYPWPIATKGGKPTVVSAEMAVVYRFHEFIIKSFPIKDALNETLWDQLVFDTGFNATGFIDAGLENVVRGIVSTSIPNFKSGVEESFRSAGKNSKAPFDIVTWSIVHEREQGLPTFNNYFRAYNEQKPKVTVPIRERFEDFSSDPQMVSELKRLYNTPDDVDLVVGCQLDESIFPHATIPTSALIISLFSLISMGNSDRFSIGFAAMRCLLVDKPWDCHPSNALEELLWKPMPREGFPNFRFYDTFWMTELDFQAHGQNLLWRIVTENSEIKCLQKNPLFPMDPVTNPILCTLPSQRVDYALLASTGAEVTLALFRQHKVEIFMSLIALALGIMGYKIIKPRAKGYPHVLYGYPILGKALDFQKDPKKLLLEGFQKYGSSGSKTFGIHIASLTHYVLSEPEDLQMMLEDNPYELKFNLSKFFKAINIPIILHKENFASNIHTNLIRTHLSDPSTIQALGKTMEVAAEHFLHNYPLVTAVAETKRYETLSEYMDRYITSISARCMVGADAYKHPELIDMFLKFNLDVDKSMGLASFVPSFLSFIAERPLNKSYNKFRDIFIPIIKRRRADLTAGQDGLLDFMPFILEVIADDKRASDLIAITVWIGLRNLQITATSTLLDIINVPDLAPKIASSLSNATIANLHTFGPDASKNTPWSLLRSSMFESIRLCGPATGPARIISSPHPVALASDPSVHLPPKQVATLSSYYSHRLPVNYGEDAAEYRAGRFVEHDPEIGSTRFIAWGLKGPHICPGRWFTQEAICVMIKALLERYEFAVERRVGDGEKYVYHAGVVTRKEVPVVVRRKV